MVKVIFGEFNFVHESFFQSYDAFPTKYLMLGLNLTTIDSTCPATMLRNIAEKNSTNHIFIIIHRNMTLNSQKQCSLSYLLNAAV
jgi:hypothetical protein